MRLQEVLDVLGNPEAELRLEADCSWKGISAVWKEVHCPGGWPARSQPLLVTMLAHVENAHLGLPTLTSVVDLHQVIESGWAVSPEVLKS